ncbi:MAG TPA: signal recognition particle protein [Clostridia bacterium]|nr:signal recognition particle protein [Clostridia bacterium]HRX41972.1 signal recognition particle protein [Clostridia bacterium]
MAVFEGLASRLENIIKGLRGRGRVTESDIKAISRELKMALLEADVNYKVVKSFVNDISEKASGADVMKSLTPGQQIIKIVHEELIKLLGGETDELKISGSGTAVVLMCGLQGTGKTTTCGKLANHLRKQGKKVMMAACDIHRPAAVQQLITIGNQLDIRVYHENSKNAVAIAKNALDIAKKERYDILIVDTAGRLHIDEDMMKELIDISKAVNPRETLLVVDSMTGQDAVNAAQHFNENMEISGIILTKLDGDTRGGAALSVKFVTGKSIKFACIGEKMNDMEVFHPDRMASRILGMGDVLSLIEKAQENVDIENARKMEKKLMDASFTLNDFLAQMEQLKQMGPLEDLLGMMPGINKAQLKGLQIDEKQIGRTKAIIQSMTKAERNNPRILDASRRKRIAAGSGNTIQSVNKLVKDFDNMKKMFKGMKNNRKSMKGFKLPF